MIYITGDTHGDIELFRSKIMYKMKDAGENDTLIICGDFGYLFTDDKYEHDFLDSLERLKFTICFADGNHENFDALNSITVSRWNGGKVHRLRRNVYHLMRGQVFTIDGRSFFTFGGAYSIDRAYRSRGESYWDEEVPCSDDYREASENLEKCGYKVDCIITHTAPREVIARLGFYPHTHDIELTGFLSWVSKEVEFGHWYFGHFHTDRELDEKFTALYHKIIEI